MNRAIPASVSCRLTDSEFGLNKFLILFAIHTAPDNRYEEYLCLVV